MLPTRYKPWRGVVTACALASALLALPVAADDGDDDEDVTDQILLELAPGATIEAIALRYGVTVIESAPELGLWKVQVAPGAEAEQVAGAMEEDAEILEAERHKDAEAPEGTQRSVPDLGISLDTSDYLNQVAVVNVRGQSAHRLYTARGLTVAVLDTGVAASHPLLAASVVMPGADFVAGTGTGAPVGDGLDNDLDGRIDEALYHGTYVAGMVHLLAPNAAILPIRVLGADGAGTTFAIARGIHHAVRQGADVINLSVAMVETSTVIETALNGALEAGVIVVAASGNDGADVVSFPAKHDGVVAVAAVDTAGVRAPFSNVGREVALSAPGVALISSYGEFGLAAWEGTSFAAPMVSGAAGLLLDKYPGLTPPQVRDLLRATAQPDANSTLEGMMGAGILDADALTAALTADRTSLELDAAVDGTHLRWSPVLGATRYDAARGDLAVLRAWAAAGGADALLGPLACLADDLPTAEAPALVDNVAPAPGQAFFYVFRDDAGGRDYGRDSAGRLRLAVDTDCSASE